MTTQFTRRASEPTMAQCAGCQSPVYRKRLARAHGVCPECGHHQRLTAGERLSWLLDDDSLEPIEHDVCSVDLLGFRDTRDYPTRLSEARAATGLDEGVEIVSGRIDGRPVVAAVLDFRFLGGSLGAAVGELVTMAAETALRRRHPLLIVSASGGARMQEGATSLMQMAKTSQALAELREHGVLTVSLITDPTYGGVAASFSTLCDVVVAEPGARLGFAGPRVVAQTIGQELPPGFQTAEFLLERGLIDGIWPRASQRAHLARLLAGTDGATGPGGVSGPVPPAGTVVRRADALPEIDGWVALRTARNLERPTTLDLVAHGFTDFVELRGDRAGGDCAAVIGGPARLGGRPVMLVGHQRARSVDELEARNWGMSSPAGYRKAVRLMALAGRLGLPVVTVVDTPGAHPGREAEENGQAMAIAESIQVMTSLPVPVVAYIAGEGGSGGALALAVANDVLIASNATYSVISPEGCAAILWNDSRRAPEAARALRIDARSLLRLGIVDGVVPEPDGGSQVDPSRMSGDVCAALSSALRRLEGRSPEELVAGRRRRFRAFGGAVTTREEMSA